jgi:uncharacterized lipoprotein YddW (UPF0748 family)
MSRLSQSLTVVVCIFILGISCARPRPRPTAPAPAPTLPPSPRSERGKPVTELRGVWVSDSTRLDWNEATARLQRAGFNTMYVNLASAGAAFYPRSKVLPSLVDGGTDEVTRGIELAHRRGIAVHAKLITFFMFKAPSESQRRMTRADRVMLGPNGRPALQSGYTWLCPTQLANREQLAAEITEILSRYRVDGLQFDYIRFYEEPTCYCDHCRAEFEHALGRHLRRWPDDVMGGVYTTQFYDWRRQVINQRVYELTSLTRRMRPDIKLSAAVFPDWERCRQDRAQDWGLWLLRGWMNYVCTMTYRTDVREFAELVRKQQAWAGNRAKIVPGIGSWKFERMSDLRTEIDTARRLGAPGFVLFSYDDAAARDFLPNLTVDR